MNITTNQSESIDHPVTSDWFFRILVAALFAVAIWLLAMPWVPAIAGSTMRRFHLQTGSFAGWAIQQPIPPMYSFANTVQVRTSDPNTSIDDPSDVLAERMVNHFPTRMFTFANGRARYLLDDHEKWFVLRSSYRGQQVDSVYKLQQQPDG
ncbi:MAG: hypothetical protein KDB00_16960, partial [Planctomycetales bacterium]|nr:hypothetical protein [Planctomycetales bacterium]